MITCSVCHTENNHLAIVCTRCGGYLQTRVDTLDLFATMWSIIEKPSKAFHKIAVAQHKNYAYVLSAVAGISFSFLIYWIIKAGEFSDSLVNIVGAAFVVGPFFGILAIQLFSLLVKLTMKAFRMQVKFRSITAVIAYAFVPEVISVILFLPIKLMTFGTFFFSRNPSPYTLKPASYLVLLGMDALFAAWSLVLLSIGIRSLINGSWRIPLSVLSIALTLLILMITVVFRLTLLP